MKMPVPERFVLHDNDSFSSYWLSPYLQKHLDRDIQIEDAKQFIPFYYKVDDSGDAVAAELFSNGFTNGMQRWNQILSSKDLDNIPDNIRKFLEGIYEVPQWFDEEKANRGAALCNRSGNAALSVLRNYCLMGGYESSAINKPLIFTGALKKGAAKRLSETLEFWVNVTSENAMRPDNPGFLSAVTTRLIHSYSRSMIEKHSSWNSDLHGKPLNIWDMLATNLGFSIVFIDGLIKLGIKPTDEEIDGLLHLWKYVGYLLGIPLEIIPDTQSQAVNALYYWSRTQKGADEDSAALAFSLHEEPQKVTFTNSRFMKNFVQNANLGYSYILLGENSCKKLKLPEKKALFWVNLTILMNKIENKIALSGSKGYEKIRNKGLKDQAKVLELYRKM